MQASNTFSQGSKPFFEAHLPLPPGVNESYKIVTVYAKNDDLERRFVGGRLRYGGDQVARRVNRIGASEALEAFKQEAALLLNTGAAVDHDVLNAIRGSKRRKVALQVSLKFFYSTRWRNDVDGGVKAVIDACFTHLGLNDNQVCRLVVEKFADRDVPRVEIEISCLVGR